MITYPNLCILAELSQDALKVLSILSLVLSPLQCSVIIIDTYQNVITSHRRIGGFVFVAIVGFNREIQ